MRPPRSYGPKSSRAALGLIRAAALTAASVSAFSSVLAPAHASTDPPLRWPTSAGRCLTSGFGEHREGHFHSGVDFSTNGKIGFDVYAVADGEIARARQSCRGYGKVVYLRLADGRFAVYAHLSEFSGALADSVRAIQRSMGDVNFDHSFAAGAIRVKRGELVGKTGQSGAGPPHLHFEIRDAGERPLDPLAHGLDAPDAAPPRISRVALTPLTPESTVDGDSRTVIVRVIQRKDGRFTAEREVPVTGRVGIAVEARDGIDACDRGMAPKHWELQDGEKTLFAVHCDRFTFDEWGLVDLQFDPRWTYTGDGDFVNLWRRPGNDFPSFAGDWPAADGVTAGAGAVSGATPSRTLTIVAADANENHTEAELVLKFDAPVDRSTPKERFASLSLVPAPAFETRGSWVEARFADLPAGTSIVALAPVSPSLTISPIGPTKARVAFVPAGTESTTVQIVLLGAEAEREERTIAFPGLAARRGETGRVASEDGVAIVQFPKGALREDTVAILRTHAALPYSDELRLIGHLHALDTGAVPLAAEYEIEMRQPADFAGDADHLGVFVHSGDRFRYIGGANRHTGEASEQATFAGSTQRPRPFGLFEDRRGPAIGRPRFAQRSKTWRIELAVRDRGAGVDCDDLAVELDGQRLLHEYDEETGEVVAILDEAPESGARRIRTWATDRLGNRSERTDTVKALSK